MDTSKKNLVIVGLKGGNASDARSALAVDLDPGFASRGEWLALVDLDLVPQLAEETGATWDDVSEPWDGSRFGDGAGTVARVNDRIVGSGAYRHLTE